MQSHLTLARCAALFATAVAFLGWDAGLVPFIVVLPPTFTLALTLIV